jgi:hypothetical protein
MIVAIEKAGPDALKDYYAKLHPKLVQLFLEQERSKPLPLVPKEKSNLEIAKHKEKNTTAGLSQYVNHPLENEMAKIQAEERVKLRKQMAGKSQGQESPHEQNYGWVVMTHLFMIMTCLNAYFWYDIRQMVQKLKSPG